MGDRDGRKVVASGLQARAEGRPAERVALDDQVGRIDRRNRPGRARAGAPPPWPRSGPRADASAGGRGQAGRGTPRARPVPSGHAPGRRARPAGPCRRGVRARRRRLCLRGRAGRAARQGTSGRAGGSRRDSGPASGTASLPSLGSPSRTGRRPGRCRRRPGPGAARARGSRPGTRRPTPSGRRLAEDRSILPSGEGRSRRRRRPAGRVPSRRGDG